MSRETDGEGAPPRRRWTWAGSSSACGATLFEDAIRFEEMGPQADQDEQPIVTFLAFGPLDYEVPSFVADELREAIRRRDASRWPQLLAAAEALRAEQRPAEPLVHPPGTAFADMPWTRMGNHRWDWGDPADRYIAWLREDGIAWEWCGPKDLGNTIEQSIESFLAFGPDEANTPAGVAAEMREAICARDPDAWPDLLARAQALRQPKGEGGAPD